VDQQPLEDQRLPLIKDVHPVSGVYISTSKFDHLQAEQQARQVSVQAAGGMEMALRSATFTKQLQMCQMT
jgi:hypothetical protein